ncbi:MAG: sulfotransferase domain-containing protein [Planctomycetaceae bacterium]
MLPQFLIIGAQKSGTTRLKLYLDDCGDLYFAPQHVRFFAKDAQYQRGIDWYASFFDACAPGQIPGAKQPGFHYLPWVPERIQAYLPNVKLIWILREPVARTYSSFWHAASRGNEWLSFEKAIEGEERRVRKDIHKGYVRRGLYADQVEQYLRFFPQEQMLFLLFEEMVADPEAVVNRALAFLGSDSRVAAPPREPKNGRRLPRSVLLQCAARSVFGYRTRGYRLMNRLNHLVPRGGGYPPLDSTMQARLQERFREPNERLAKITGLKLDDWWERPGASARQAGMSPESRPVQAHADSGVAATRATSM